MATLVIRPLDQIAAKYGEALLLLGKGKANRVLARAMNYEGRKAFTQVKRDVQKQGTFPRGIVQAAVKFKSAGPKTLQTEIVGQGRPLNLQKFGSRRFSYGVRAKVWDKFQFYHGAFIVPAYGNMTYVRETKDRGPIKQVFGAGIARELVRDHAPDAYNASVPLILARIEKEILAVLRGF